MCDLADAILECAPWHWMEEGEIFALRPEPDSEVYFVSVMGSAGEHMAVAYYPGMESFMKFRACQSGDLSPQDGMEEILLNGHLQAGFETRQNLEPAEKAALKSAKRTYRGLWPVFRSHRAARVPWPVDAQEAGILTKLMAATLPVLDRVAAGEDLLRPYDEDEFFLRGPDGADGTCRLADLPVPHHRLQALLDSDALDGVPRAKLHAEMELALMLSPISDVPRGEAPYFPFMLMLVDTAGGNLLGVDLLSTADGVDAALVRLPEAITRVIRQGGVVPSSIAVRHPVLLSAMLTYGRLHGIKCEGRPFLPSTAGALASLHQFMR